MNCPPGEHAYARISPKVVAEDSITQVTTQDSYIWDEMVGTSDKI
jgi:hypothetical protein